MGRRRRLRPPDAVHRARDSRWRVHDDRETRIADGGRRPCRRRNAGCAGGGAAASTGRGGDVDDGLQDRKSGEEGESVAGRVDLGGRRSVKTKNTRKNEYTPK